MPRPVLLYSGSWSDVALDEFAPQAAEWGYAGLELCCWGDHFEVQRALSEPDYCQEKLELLSRHDLSAMVLSNHRVGQAVCDRIDERHQSLLPDYVWGDGSPEGVRQRATEEMVATVRAAEKLGVGIVAGFSGSSLWSSVVGYPGAAPDLVARGLRDFARAFSPILDACRDHGIRFAYEVHPGQYAYDYYSTEQVLEELSGRDEFGLLFDPSHLHWMGVDAAAFVRRFGERIFHVHIKDAALTLDGRSGVLNSSLPTGDARRGWDFRAPGHGGVDWENLIRALNEVSYEGPLAVEFKDAGMDRAYGAEEACRFVKRLDFEAPPRRRGDDAFR